MKLQKTYSEWNFESMIFTLFNVIFDFFLKNDRKNMIELKKSKILEIL